MRSFELDSSTAARRSVRSRGVVIALAMAFVVAGAVAQDPAKPSVPPASTPPAPAAGAATPPASNPQGAPQNEAPKFGRIVVDKAPLRCWPGTAAQPPVFEDVLAKDQVVAVGRSENGFRAIVLPLGPLGYVNRKFAEVSPDGVVKTKGAKVAFRYRARSSEAPVTTLPDGTTLHVVAEQAEWFQVRVPAVEAWVAEAEVQIGDQADAALAAGYAELKAKHESEVKARLDQIAAAKKREEQDKADLAALQVIQDQFATEMRKPVAEQKYQAVDEALDKFVTTIAAESSARAVADSLKKRIETQRWVAEATVLRDDKPAPVAAPTSEPKDQLDRFQSIGWLRYERRLGGPGTYYLEKGGRRQYLVTCNTGRYDLALFVDREVGIAGPRRRPATESLSVLDAERLEVLGTPMP